VLAIGTKSEISKKQTQQILTLIFTLCITLLSSVTTTASTTIMNDEEEKKRREDEYSKWEIQQSKPH